MYAIAGVVCEGQFACTKVKRSSEKFTSLEFAYPLLSTTSSWKKRYLKQDQRLCLESPN